MRMVLGSGCRVFGFDCHDVVIQQETIEQGHLVGCLREQHRRVSSPQPK